MAGAYAGVSGSGGAVQRGCRFIGMLMSCGGSLRAASRGRLVWSLRIRAGTDWKVHVAVRPAAHVHVQRIANWLLIHRFVFSTAILQYCNHFNIGAFMEKCLTMRAGQTPVQKYWCKLLEMIEVGRGGWGAGLWFGE